MKLKLLSPKEHCVLQHLHKGYRYAEIAALERVALCTVQTYVKRLYAKLAVKTRAEAVFEAQSNGLITA